MRKSKYAVPACARCDQAKYDRWLKGKAKSHVVRDRKRARKNMPYATIVQYKQMIHSAVCESKGDFYTGLPLDWSLISKWDSASAKRGGAEHKRSFANLPTVDHTLDEQGNLKFVICASYVNAAKGDLSIPDFYLLCESVLEHRSRNARKK